MCPPRYDGVADWYSQLLVESGRQDESVALVGRLLGPGPGRLVDVGCGPGLQAAALARLGWDVVGVDESDDQLRLARRRGVETIRGDAAELPFADASFDAALSTWTHTDVPDFPALLAEVARVVRPGGPFVYLGVHPCFVGPHAAVYERDVPELHTGYRDTAFQTQAPGIREAGLRAKVGATHLPLGRLLQTFLDAGLTIVRVEEPDEPEYPHGLALALRVPAPAGPPPETTIDR